MKNTSTNLEVKQMKTTFHKTGWMLFLYDVVLYASVLGFSVVQSLQITIANPTISEDDLYELLSSSGLSSLIGLAFGVLVIVLFRRKKLFQYDLVHQENQMTLEKFGKILCCFMAVQFLFSLVNLVIELFFNQFGLTLNSQMEAATATSTTFSMFLYGSIFAPIIEEVVFRGAVLRSLEKYGKIFAIMTSSILFGIYHGNFSQGLFATCVGFVLSYVALEYAFKWAVLLHIANNFIFGDLMSFLTDNLSENLQIMVTNLIMITFFVLGVHYLFRYRTAIQRYYQQQFRHPDAYRLFFTSAGVILFILLNLYMAVSTVEVLP